MSMIAFHLVEDRARRAITTAGAAPSDAVYPSNVADFFEEAFKLREELTELHDNGNDTVRRLRDGEYLLTQDGALATKPMWLRKAAPKYYKYGKNGTVQTQLWRVTSIRRAGAKSAIRLLVGVIRRGKNPDGTIGDIIEEPGIYIGYTDRGYVTTLNEEVLSNFAPSDVDKLLEDVRALRTSITRELYEMRRKAFMLAIEAEAQRYEHSNN